MELNEKLGVEMHLNLEFALALHIIIQHRLNIQDIYICSKHKCLPNTYANATMLGMHLCPSLSSRTLTLPVPAWYAPMQEKVVPESARKRVILKSSSSIHLAHNE